MRKRRLLSGVLAAVLAIGTLGTGTAFAKETEVAVPTDGLIADYDFSTEPEDGKTLVNLAEGKDAVEDAVIHNTAVWEDNALVFDGQGNSNEAIGTWVELPDDILKGATSASITIEAKGDASILGNYHFLWSIGNSGTDTYWFMNMREPRGTIKYGGSEKIASGFALEADRWYSFTSVIDAEEETLTFYIDGAKAGEIAATGMSIAQVSDQSRNTIGRAPYGDPMFKGSVASFRVYDRALDAEEVKAISDHDGQIHADEYEKMIDAAAEQVKDFTVSDSHTQLPTYNGLVTWKSETDKIEVSEDGVSAAIAQPEPGSEPIVEELTAVVNLRGVVTEKKVNVTIDPAPAADDPYGYLLVHFVEDNAGYQEKIYLDISRGDNPEQWDPLNGRQPILVSNKNTTGARDPFITYNPETETYYIIATDLRVFGGKDDYYSNVNYWWGEWSRVGSTLMNVWESKDLIHWSENRQFDVTLDKEGNKVAELGMMWAPETTWVPDYYGEDEGAFVVYWSSNIYDLTDTSHSSSRGTHIMWGVTTDFTQETFEFGGKFLDGGSAGMIDTTMIQEDGKTYHISKSHAEAIIMESTTAKEWWKEGTKWTRIQSYIGSDRFGGTEGPAVFKDHSKDNSYYLFVDDMPSPGYQPMYSTNLDEGWDYIDSADYFLTSETKHGGVISLTKAQYDALREADAVSAVKEDLGTAVVEVGTPADAMESKLPQTAEVNLAFNRGTSELPVIWDLSEVDTTKAGDYVVTGVVDSLGANDNQWVGDDGDSTVFAENKTLYSSTAIEVTVTVKVMEGEGLPYVDVENTDWFYEPVAYTYYENIMTGMDEKHFGPYGQLSRAQFVLMLYRMEGTPNVQTAKTFGDITGDEWYGKAVLWAAEAGVVGGYTDGNFGPTDNITREQMAVMMHRYADYLGQNPDASGDYSKCTDAASVSEFAKDAMKWAYGNGIITGKENGTLIDPQGNTARCEAAAIIQRFVE